MFKLPRAKHIFVASLHLFRGFNMSALALCETEWIDINCTVNLDGNTASCYILEAFVKVFFN